MRGKRAGVTIRVADVTVSALVMKVLRSVIREEAGLISITMCLYARCHLTHPVVGFSSIKDAEKCELLIVLVWGMGGSWPVLQWTSRKETVLGA